MSLEQAIQNLADAINRHCYQYAPENLLELVATALAKTPTSTHLSSGYAAPVYQDVPPNGDPVYHGVVPQEAVKPKAPKPSKTPAPTPGIEEKTANTPDTPPFKDVFDAVFALMSAKGKGAVFEVLKTLGVERASHLAPEQYAGAIELLNKAKE